MLRIEGAVLDFTECICEISGEKDIGIGPFVLPAVDYFEVVNQKIRQSKSGQSPARSSKAKSTRKATGRDKS